MHNEKSENLGFKILKDFFYLGQWTKTEIVILAISLLSTISIVVIFNSSIFVAITSVIGILCAINLAKGRTIGNFFGALVCILYSIVAYQTGLYGEVISYLFLMLPFFLFSIFSWAKNQRSHDKTVIANEIKETEWRVIALLEGFLFIGTYFLLKALNTEELIVSSISFVIDVFSVYLLFRRNKYGFLLFIFDDFSMIALWGILALKGNYLVLPMLVNPIINLINDTYAIINWTKLNESSITLEGIKYKEVSRKDKPAVLKIINTVMDSLEDQELFVPYEKYELENLFNSNYAILHGAYDKNELVGISQLYQDQNFLNEYKELTDLTDYRICQIGGSLVYSKYKNRKIIKNLVKIQVEVAKAKAYNYIIAMVHPSLLFERKIFESVGFKYHATVKLSNGFPRDFFIIKL